MKKVTNILLIGVGLYAAHLLIKNSKPQAIDVTPEHEPDVLKKGSFSKEVEKLQKNINEFKGKELIVADGAYSNEFKKIVEKIFNNTTILKDPTTGEIYAAKIKELNVILENINKNLN